MSTVDERGWRLTTFSRTTVVLAMLAFFVYGGGVAVCNYLYMPHLAFLLPVSGLGLPLAAMAPLAGLAALVALALTIPRWFRRSPRVPRIVCLVFAGCSFAVGFAAGTSCAGEWWRRNEARLLEEAIAHVDAELPRLEEQRGRDGEWPEWFHFDSRGGLAPLLVRTGDVRYRRTGESFEITVNTSRGLSLNGAIYDGVSREWCYHSP